MEHETAGEDLPDPSPLVALAFLSPWALASLLLPEPWRMASLGLVALLALLLLCAAAWSFRTATARGLDAGHWAFVTVLTLGLAMLPLAFGPRGHAGPDPIFVCSECGRQARTVEPFCHACGAA